MLGVGGGGQQEAPGGAGQGHDEHAALIGAHLRPGGRHGAAAAASLPRCGGVCGQAAGDGVDEQAGAGQGVPQAQVRPAVPLQSDNHNKFPLLARATRRGHDGHALRAPPLGGDGVRGQDLGVELGQEAGGVLARVALRPDLGAFEQGGDDVEVVLGGLGQERSHRARRGLQGGGAPGLGPLGGVPGGPQQGLDIARGLGRGLPDGRAQGLKDPGCDEEPVRLGAQRLPVQGPGEAGGLLRVGQQGQEGGVAAGSGPRPSGGISSGIDSGHGGGTGGGTGLTGLGRTGVRGYGRRVLAQPAAQSTQVHGGQSHQGAGEEVDGGVALGRFTVPAQLVADGGAHDVQECGRGRFCAQQDRGCAGGQGHASSAQVPGEGLGVGGAANDDCHL